MEAQQIINLWDEIDGEWSSFKSLWKSAGTYTLPQGNNLMVPPKDAIVQQGMDKTTRLVDTTAVEANRNLAAGLYAFLFPVNEQPFTLEPEPEEAADDHDIALAASEMTRITQLHLATSNFSMEMFGFLEKFGCYGGACMYSEKSKKTGKPVYRDINIQNIRVMYDSDGLIDTVMYRFAFTPRQAAQKWVADPAKAESVLSKKLADKLGVPSEMNKHTDFIHIVYPRKTWNPMKQDAGGMPWVSQYVYVEGKHVIPVEAGYNEMPYSIVWFWKSSEESAGRGPGTEGLPEYRMINRMRKTFIKSAEKQCDPPYFAPDDGALSPFRTDPAGIIFYRPGLSQNDFWSLDTKPDARLTLEVLDRQVEIINGKFYNHLFRPLEDYRNMTATETIERTEQNFRLLNPPVSRLTLGLLEPQIIRTVNILRDGGYFPFLDTLPDFKYRIQFRGKLALAIKELEGHAFSQAVNVWAGYLQIDPSPLENIDADKGFRETMRARGVPADWLKDSEIVAGQRQARMQQEQMSQMIAEAETVGKATKELGKPVDDSSVLKKLAG